VHPIQNIRFSLFNGTMENFLLIIIPFLSAMLLRRLGIFREKHALYATSYVINFSLPCLAIITISNLDLKHGNFTVAVIAWIVMAAGACLSFFAGRLLNLSGGKLRSFILVVTFPNTCFLGYPLTYALYGSTGLPYAVIYDQMGMVPFFLTLGFIVAGGRKSLGSALKFPPFIALLFALLINMTGVGIPGPISFTLKWAGWTTLPLTIFLIGVKVTFTAVRDYRNVAASLALRMVAIPALLFVSMSLLGIEGLPYKVALLETTMPPALTTSILALKYGLDDEFAVASISAGTVLCMFAFAVMTFFR
jgi:predicted permease